MFVHLQRTIGLSDTLHRKPRVIKMSFEFEKEKTLEGTVVDTLRSGALTVCFAESCTGGMCAQRIVSVSGASEVFLGGVVSYANSAKMRILGVKESTLDDHGAVSEETAREMARGARDAFLSDIAVSVSGIAGPGGGTEQKPVGTVCFGVSSVLGEFSETVHFKNNGREKIREAAAEHALTLVCEQARSILSAKTAYVK